MADPLELTRRLLDAIACADWRAYTEHCAEDMTCFEPETEGRLVHGVEFHKQFFDSGGHLGTHESTVEEPFMRWLGDDAALVCYRRIVRAQDETTVFLETRLWQRIGDEWKHVHFHRSRS